MSKNNQNDFDLNPSEEKAIRILRKLEKEWPKSLWLFSASGSLCVMRKDENGERAVRPSGEGDGDDQGGGMNSDYIVTTINIENDGGDW